MNSTHLVILWQKNSNFKETCAELALIPTPMGCRAKQSNLKVGLGEAGDEILPQREKN
jgi:hypothetical protein